MWQPAISLAALDEGFLKTKRPRPRGVSIMHDAPESDRAAPPDRLLKPIAMQRPDRPRAGARLRSDADQRPAAEEEAISIDARVAALEQSVDALKTQRQALAIWTGVGVFLLTAGLLVFVTVRTR